MQTCANLQFALSPRQFALLLAALLQLALELLAVSFTGHQRMLHIVNKLLERCLRLQMHSRQSYQTTHPLCVTVKPVRQFSSLCMGASML
jgi:hypothetical protein